MPSRRIQSIAQVFESDTTHANDSTSTLRAKQAQAEIDRSPIPEPLTLRPEVPPRPVGRKNKNPREQQEQTPPPSPQDEFHTQRRERSQTPTPPRRPPTPENSTISIEDQLLNDPNASLSDFENQLADLKIEVKALHDRLDDRAQVEAKLSHDLEEANKRYRQAISDLQKSQEETNALRNQVRRLREELDEESVRRRHLEDEIDKKRTRQRELEADIDARMGREQELGRISDRMARLEAQRAVEGREQQPFQELDPPGLEHQPRRQSSGRRKSIHLYLEGKSESRMSWNKNFSSKYKKTAGKKDKGS